MQNRHQFAALQPSRSSLSLRWCVRRSPRPKPPFAYVESFRKGPTRVTEQSMQVDLDPHNATCDIRVKDQSGKDRYRFGCVPQRAAAGDDRITGWQVQLGRPASQDLSQRASWARRIRARTTVQIGWLDPGKFAKIPLNTERVVKVDNFYCVFQVTDSHFIAPGQPYLDHLTLDIRFTNTMPHSEIRTKQEKTPS